MCKYVLRTVHGAVRRIQRSRTNAVIAMCKYVLRTVHGAVRRIQRSRTNAVIAMCKPMLLLPCVNMY